jgi:hypothetical protein
VKVERNWKEKRQMKMFLSSGADGVLAHVTGPFINLKLGKGIFK